MAIEVYSKSNLNLIEHFGYLGYETLDILRKEAERLKLSNLQFLPYGGDIIFNPEQSQYILKYEIPLLQGHLISTPRVTEALDMIYKAASSVSQKNHTFLIFEGD